MSSSLESVRVVIFGTEYSIKADVDIDITREVAKYVNTRMTEIHENTASRDNYKIAVLSALNIAGEFFEIKAKHEEASRQLSELQEKVTMLTKRLDELLQS